MQKTNEKKTALITGATSGIGAAYAYALAEKGYDLIITGRRRDVIEGVANEIEKKFKVKVNVAIAELSDRGDIDKLVDVIKNTGSIEFLVNNAGFTTKGYYYQEGIVEQEKMVLVHAIAMMKLTHAVLPSMIERRSGNIINVASIQAVTPMSLSTTYCSVKAFMKNFSICLYCELKDFGIKVQCVLPGFTRTDLGRCIGVDMKKIEEKPMMHWMMPEEVAKISLDGLNKKNNNVICIPGFGNKLLYFFAKIIPDRLWCAIVPAIAKSMP